MKIIHIRILFLVPLLALFMSCASDTEDLNVDPEVQPYVNRFIEEADKRGILIDFSDTGLSIRLVDLGPEEAGRCSERGTATSGNHDIEIDRSYWAEVDELEKERLIFHELGHCELNRSHDNQVFSNGDWKSMMYGSPLPPNRPNIINYSGRRIEYYRDELFNSSTAVPDWITIEQAYSVVAESEKSEILAVDNGEEFTEPLALGVANNYEIELVARQPSEGSWIGISWGGDSDQNSYSLTLEDGRDVHLGSGRDLYGDIFTLRSADGATLLERKYTVRKQGDLFYYFINEEFIYWSDALPFREALIRSISAQNVGLEGIQSLRVFELQ